MRSLLILGVVVVSTGCGSGQATLDAGSGSGGGSAGSGGGTGSGFDAGGDSDVTAQYLLRYTSNGPAVTVPVDTSTLEIGAWVDGDGGYTFFPGSGSSDGGIRVPNVPQGEFVFQMGTNFIVGSARFVEMTADIGGRADAGRLASPTPLSLTLANMSAWNEPAASGQPTDFLGVFVPNAGLLDEGLARTYTGRVVQNSPAQGATALNALTFDQATIRGSVAIDGALGDVAHFFKETNVSTNPVTFVTTDIYEAPPFTSVSGSPTTLSGGFTPVARTQTFSTNWQLSQYWARNAEFGPGGVQYHQYIGLSAHPFGLARGVFANSGLIVSFQALYGRLLNQDTTFTAQYGDPFPSLSGVCLTSYDVLVPISVPPTTGRYLAAGVDTKAAGPCPATIGLTLTPPSLPLINGMPMDQQRTGVGLAPVISWSAPSIGTPSLYVLDVYELTVTGTTQTDRLVATVITPKLQFRVAPSTLLPGGNYVVRLGAVTLGAEGSPFTRPFFQPLPFTRANRVTAIVSP